MRIAVNYSNACATIVGGVVAASVMVGTITAPRYSVLVGIALGVILYATLRHLSRDSMAREHAEALAHKLNAELYRQSITDPLTGLFNRRHYDTIAKTLLDEARREGVALSMLVIDIDKFKEINDTYGHAYGDNVLLAVTRVLRSRLRRSDIIVRLGGDEFVVWLQNADSATARAVAESLRYLVDLKTSVTISTGIATARSCDTPARLFLRADRALYAVKHTGRNACMDVTSLPAGPHA